MEKIPSPDTKEVIEIKTLVEHLVGKAPQESAMQALKMDLLKGLGAAKDKNGRIMEQAFQSAYGHHNALAAKKYDVLEQLEEIFGQIRSVAK
jgi:hypothetical protein